MIIQSLRVAFNPWNPQSEGNKRVAYTTALAVITAGVTARFRNQSLPLGLRGIHIMIASGLIAVALPIIRRLYVKLYPDLFWVWDEVHTITKECPGACYRESTSLRFCDLSSWPTLLYKGDEFKRGNQDLTDARAKELYDKAPGLFELVVEEAAEPNNLGDQLAEYLFDFTSKLEASLP